MILHHIICTFSALIGRNIILLIANLKLDLHRMMWMLDSFLIYLTCMIRILFRKKIRFERDDNTHVYFAEHFLMYSVYLAACSWQLIYAMDNLFPWSGYEKLLELGLA